MSNIIKKLMNAARYFTVADFTIFKLYLLSAGILLGAYFSSFFLNCITLFWIIAIGGGIYLIGRTFTNYHKPER